MPYSLSRSLSWLFLGVIMSVRHLKNNIMMHDNLIISNNPPSIDILAALYFDADWIKEADNTKLQHVIENTSRWWIAKDKTINQTFGMGRVLTDWGRCACIYDVIVFSNYQKKGIGSSIMVAILHDLNEVDIDIIHLWPAKGKIAFYERFGFAALSNEQPMMKYQRKIAEPSA